LPADHRGPDDLLGVLAVADPYGVSNNSIRPPLLAREAAV
jgi:hypothetical protein